MEHEGGWRDYTLRAARAGDVLGTIEYDQPIIGDRTWDPHDPDGTLRATVTWAGSLRNLLSFSTQEECDVTSPEGDRLGTFERVKDGLNYGMEIGLDADEIPPAVGIALAYSVLRKANL